MVTIWCALFTSSPDSPRMSGWCSFTASTSFSGGTLMPRFTTWKPLLARMISTRFLPMSWTSPFTVASTTLPRLAVWVLSIFGSRWVTAAFIASALCSTSATISSLAPNSRPTSSIPFISGPLMISSGPAFWSASSRSSISPSRLPSMM